MPRLSGPALLLALGAALPAQAQELGGAEAHAAPAAAANGCPRVYTLADLAPHNPRTAADIVAQAPGFVLDLGADERGLGGRGANLQIDGEAIDAKNGSGLETLALIPAELIERIELFTSACADTAPHNTVLNLVRVERARRSATLEANLTSRGEQGASGEAHGGYEAETEVGNFALVGEASDYRSSAPPQVSRLGVAIAGVDSRVEKRRWSARYDHSIDRLAIAAEFERSLDQSASDPRGDAEGARSASGSAVETSRANLEFAARVSSALEGRLRFFRAASTSRAQASYLAASGASQSLTRSEQHEDAIRADLDWLPASGWRLGVAAHAARTSADNAFEIFLDGVAQPLPGALATVVETRYGAAATLSGPLSQRLSLESELRLDRSDLVSGGTHTVNETLSPRVAIRYAIDDDTTLSLVAARESAQLDFGYFLASASLQDEEVSVAAQALRPETKSFAELALSRRFARTGVVDVSLRHARLHNPISSIPVLPLVEAPANTNPATETSLAAALTAPLDELGLAGATLTLDARAASSRTIDPVSGEERAISGEAPLHWSLAWRQALRGGVFNWGVGVNSATQTESYGVRQIARFNTGVRYSADLSWRPDANWDLALTLGGPLRTQTRTLLFSMPRERDLAPILRQDTTTDSAAQIAASAEWRLNETALLRFRIAAPIDTTTLVRTLDLTENRLSEDELDGSASTSFSLGFRLQH